MTSENAVLSKVSRLWALDANSTPTQLLPEYLANNLSTASAGAVPVLQSDRTVSWQAGSGIGTVTMVNTGTGLSGGPITGIGTISLLPAVGSTTIGGVKAGSNITIAADGTISASGGGGSLSIQVDGTGVNLTNNTVNFVDSQSVANRVLAANSMTNQISFDVDSSTPFWASTLGFIASNTLKLNLSVADGGNLYNLVLPANQGGANQVLANDGAGNLSWVTVSGGGGGGSFTSSAIWTGGTTSKDAYTSPGVVNSQGITLTLVASSGAGQITNATVRLNGTALTNTYSSTGSFPNYTITIPVADLNGNPAETAASVAISITGTFNGSGVNIAAAGMLTNVQPVAFTTVLSGSYAVSSVPFYTTTATLNYSYTNPNQITSFGGVFTPTNTPLFPQNATAPASSFPNVNIGGASISGSATGFGLNGAGTSSVTLTGSVPAVPTFIPAFYAQTADNTPPTFTTASTQTAGAAQGSNITYPVATASTQYNWVCTQRPLANLMLSTTFGNTPLVPDVTGAAQTISGQTFNVYGWTLLGVGTASVLVIS